MELTPDTHYRLLREFADWLSFEDAEPVEWVVCGGTALALQELSTRPTRDVDVLAAWNNGLLVCIEEFNKKVLRCIQRVVENHPEIQGPGAKWINLGPKDLARTGLPEGYEQRLTTITFGTTLKLHLLGRPDLICLKFYAAADERCPRQHIHLDDLRNLKPTFAELEAATKWVGTRRDFETLRPELKRIATELGHDDLAYYI